MSSRQIRRLREQLQAAKLDKNDDPDSEDDFEPLYVNSSKTCYDLLSKSSTQDTDNEEGNDSKDKKDSFSLLAVDSAPDGGSDENGEASDVTDEAIAAATQKKKKNNKKKRKKNRDKQVAPPSDSPDMEVERAIAEVNQLLGEPEKPVAFSSGRPLDVAATGQALLSVNHKFLSSEDELTRRFGPYEEEGKKHQRPNILRQLKRQISLPHDDYSFSVSGLTMELINQKDDVKYFKFVHNPKYQMNVRGIIGAVKFQLARVGAPDHDIYSMTTIEATLQNVDLYFMLEEYTAANNTLEATIFFLQNLFCPSFSYIGGNTRLSYEIVENRPFHIILLKYLHLLTNKACHRTALEIAKLLLSLDPSDPLGVIFIMDTLALRAREHQWLVQIYEFWKTERDAGELFHMMYSNALAKYHLYLKSKLEEDLAEASRDLKQAILQYPNVVVMLMTHCCQKCPEITDHELFSTLPNATTSNDLKDLQRLYVAFAGPKWREGDIMKWFIANVKQIKNQYDSDTQMKIDYCEAANARFLLFKKHPIEIKRYLYAIRSMSNLLVEGAVPNVKETYSFNPYPRKGAAIDVHGYFVQRAEMSYPPSGWRSFLESLAPPRPAEEEVD